MKRLILFIVVAVGLIVAGYLNARTEVDHWKVVGIDKPDSKKALLVGIEYDGTIVADAGKQMRRLWEDAIINGQSVAYFKLNSTGGSVYGGIAMAQIMRGSIGQPPILIDGYCFSACAIAALLTGPGRIVLGAEAAIGVHQIIDTETNKPLPDITKAVISQLRGVGVPETALRRMATTKPTDISYLNQDELMKMNVQGRYVVPKVKR